MSRFTGSRVRVIGKDGYLCVKTPDGRFWYFDIGDIDSGSEGEMLPPSKVSSEAMVYFTKVAGE